MILELALSQKKSLSLFRSGSFLPDNLIKLQNSPSHTSIQCRKHRFE